MKYIDYDIVETIGILSEDRNGWTKELNLISWNERKPKFDIRNWSPDHDKLGKGVTFTKEELLNLRDLLNSLDL